MLHRATLSRRKKETNKQTKIRSYYVALASLKLRNLHEVCTTSPRPVSSSPLNVLVLLRGRGLKSGSVSEKGAKGSAWGS